MSKTALRFLSWATGRMQLPFIEGMKTVVVVGGGEDLGLEGEGQKRRVCCGCVEFKMAVTTQVGIPMVGYVSAEFREGTELEKSIWDSTALTWD